MEKPRYVLVIFLMVVPGAFAVEKPTSPQQTCVTSQCHADYSKNRYVHGPVGLGDCEVCHETVDEKKHTWQLTVEQNELCENCHSDQTTGKNLHKALDVGKCTQCHNPHSSDNKFFLVEPTVAQLCQNCHQIAEDAKFLHGPVAAKECTLCHNSHSSDYENLLVMAPSELCFSCHVVTKNELKKFEFVHEPAKKQCASCHDAHGADNSMLLKAQTPELCYPCHEDIKEVAENSKYRHSVVTEQGGCLKCHTPHASTVEYELRADPMTLCTSCHDKPVGVGKDKVIGSFTDQINGKKFLHGPVAQKNCKGCHISHGSKYFRLLTEEYPPQFYATFSTDNYKLCFSCHPESLVLTKQTSELTDFRNGDLNLHYLHVNKPRRGRTCRSCHATHASNLPKHIRKSVPYGIWELPIQFEKTETGGGCKPGCHLPFAYDRQGPVVYKRP